MSGVTDDKGKQLSSLGQAWVGRNMTIALAAYLLFVSIVLILGIVQLWPPPTDALQAGQTSETSFLLWKLTLTAEAHLILLVILASAIGTQAHALRSLYWYVGNRNLRYSWMMRYILMPFAGIALGLVFYFVIRGGFFAAGSSVDALSPFGFVAMAVLVGMFTDEAAERLKKVATSIFDKAPEGTDPAPASQGTPSK